jgi:hypothetical protein
MCVRQTQVDPCLYSLSLQIHVSVIQTLEGKQQPFLDLSVQRVGTRVTVRTFDLQVDAYLGTVSLQQLQYERELTFVDLRRPLLIFIIL